MKNTGKLILLNLSIAIAIAILICISLFLFVYKDVKLVQTQNEAIAVNSYDTNDIFSVSSNNVNLNEEVVLTLDLNSTDIKSLTLNIYFDDSIIEYIGSNENDEDLDNVNILDNRLIFTYTNILDENYSISFKFKGILSGSTNIVANGEYYDLMGNIVEAKDFIDIINIVDKDLVKENSISNYYNLEEAVSSYDSSLKIMRINKEGISPIFDKDIFQYYFVTNENISSLDLIAIANNNNAVVEIEGNSNFVYGKNIVYIKVISENKTQTSIYKINVTKTTDLELSNANLTNLAIREAISLSPEFDKDITKYFATVSNDINSIEILAIPEIKNVSVNIDSSDELIIGDNTVKVTVNANDNTTTKTYEIIVHRQSIDEEIIANNKKTEDAQKLATIINEDNSDNYSEYENSYNTNNKISENKNYDNLIVYLLVSLILAVLLKVTKIKSK